MSLKIKTVKAGDGQTIPKVGQTVVIHYTGMLNGKKIDSSRDRDTPLSFRLGKNEVIKGWEVGISQMSVGQRAIIVCPPSFAYGEKGHPGIIPPSSTLEFDVELLKLE